MYHLCLLASIWLLENPRILKKLESNCDFNWIEGKLINTWQETTLTSCLYLNCHSYKMKAYFVFVLVTLTVFGRMPPGTLLRNHLQPSIEKTAHPCQKWYAITFWRMLLNGYDNWDCMIQPLLGFSVAPYFFAWHFFFYQWKWWRFL